MLAKAIYDAIRVLNKANLCSCTSYHVLFCQLDYNYVYYQLFSSLHQWWSQIYHELLMKYYIWVYVKLLALLALDQESQTHNNQVTIYSRHQDVTWFTTKRYVCKEVHAWECTEWMFQVIYKPWGINTQAPKTS